MPNPSEKTSKTKRKQMSRKKKPTAARLPRNRPLPNNNHRPEHPPEYVGLDGSDDTDPETEPSPPLQIQHDTFTIGQPAILYGPIFQGILPQINPDETPIIQTDVAAADFSYLFPTSAQMALSSFFIPSSSPHRQYIYRATAFSYMQFVLTQELDAATSPETPLFSLTFQTPTMDGPLSPHRARSLRVIAWKCSQAGDPDLLFDVQTLLSQCACIPHILIVMNTGGKYIQSVSIMEKLHYSSCHIIPPMGETGGAWIYWNQADVDLDEMTTDHSYAYLKFFHPENYMQQSRPVREYVAADVGA